MFSVLAALAVNDFVPHPDYVKWMLEADFPAITKAGLRKAMGEQR